MNAVVAAAQSAKICSKKILWYTPRVKGRPPHEERGRHRNGGQPPHPRSVWRAAREGEGRSVMASDPS